MKRHNPRVPVLNPDGTPAMPTTASRARRWLRDGKARIAKNKLGIFTVQLLQEPNGYAKQEMVIGLDSGKLFSGIAVQSKEATHFTAHLELPFKTVCKRMEQRRMMRRNRRYRKCRTMPARFDNRKSSGPPPSIRANRQLELRIVKELSKVFPISSIYFEIVQANGDKGFSPVMVGQYWMVKQLQVVTPVVQKFGYETAIVRRELGLKKDKSGKSKQVVEAHAVDGIALACIHFKKYERFIEHNAEGFIWKGEVKVTPCKFNVIKRPPVSRRQLHLMNFSVGGVRRNYGGTTTPFGYRKADMIRAQQGSKVFVGYVSGAVESKKLISVSNFDWKRLGQCALSKTNIVRRNYGFIIR